MIKLLVLFILLKSLPAMAGHHIPGAGTAAPAHEHGHDKQIDLRVFYPRRNINFMLEYIHTDHELRDTERQLLVGGKYRLHTNFKAGLYMGYVWGHRHDEDWVPDWVWRSTKDRKELLGVGELVGRYLFDLDTPMIAEMRIRVFRNFEFDKTTLRIRPRIGTTLRRKGKPFVTLALMHERYYPMDYSAASVYAWWTYFGALFHVNKNFKTGPFYAVGSEVWEPEEELWRSTTGEAWKADEEIKKIGFMFNFVIL